MLRLAREKVSEVFVVIVIKADEKPTFRQGVTSRAGSEYFATARLLSDLAFELEGSAAERGFKLRRRATARDRGFHSFELLLQAKFMARQIAPP